MQRYSPNFETEEEANRAYMASGRIAMHWGLVEQLFEHIIILTRFHQDEDTKEPFPFSFANKIKEIKSRLNDQRISDVIETKIRTAVSDGKKLHRIRSVVVHGICKGLRLDGRIEYGMSDQKKGVAYTPVHYKFEELEVAGENMLYLHQELTTIFQTLQGTLFGKHAPNPKR